MAVYFSKRADGVKFYLALWFVAFLGLWVNFFQAAVQPFRVSTISYFLVYLAVLVGAYWLLFPLLKSVAVTAEKSKWLPFVPALLLLLHWLFGQLDLMFAPGGRLVNLSFSILVNPLWILFLAWGIVLYLLAAKPQAMDAVFASLQNTLRLFVAVAYLALGPLIVAQIIQSVSALLKVGVDSYAWTNYSQLGATSDGGLVVVLLAGILLLLIPFGGWILLQELLVREKKNLKLPVRWLALLPLPLIALAALLQPETFWQAQFIITAVFSLLSILVNFMVPSPHPVAAGIVRLMVSYFLYPYRYFRKIVAYGKKDLEVSENENAAIDYFCYYIKGAICVAILLAWALLAVYPVLKYLGISLLPLPRLEFFPLQTFHALLIYPLLYFVLLPVYALLITIFYEVLVILLQILVRINRLLNKLLEKNG